MCSKIVGLLKAREEQEERIRKLKPRDTTFDELILKKIENQIKEEEFKIKENLEKYHKQKESKDKILNDKNISKI